MKTLICNIVLFSVAISHFGVAYADDESVSVRGGTLTLTGESDDMKLAFNDRKLRDGDGFRFSFVEQYTVGDTDVVLMMSESGGIACPAQYFFVAVTTQGAVSLSPEFGTCSDLAEPVQNGSKIIVTMPNMADPGNARYVFADGVVTENGTPLK